MVILLTAHTHFVSPSVGTSSSLTKTNEEKDGFQLVASLPWNVLVGQPCLWALLCACDHGDSQSPILEEEVNTDGEHFHDTGAHPVEGTLACKHRSLGSSQPLLGFASSTASCYADPGDDQACFPPVLPARPPSPK